MIGYSLSIFAILNHVDLTAGQAPKPSWTYGGEALPFADLAPFSHPPGKVVYRDYFTPLINNSEKYQSGMISVEQIKCPLLLLTGKDDLIWPSTALADLIEEKSRGAVRHVAYEGAGHQFFGWNKEKLDRIVESQSLRLQGIKKHRFVYGGSKEGTIRAMVESKKEVLQFLSARAK